MADKGVFVLLFMSQGIENVKVSMDMLDEQIPGPCADQPTITGSSVIQVKASVRNPQSTHTQWSAIIVAYYRGLCLP